MIQQQKQLTDIRELTDVDGEIILPLCAASLSRVAHLPQRFSHPVQRVLEPADAQILRNLDLRRRGRLHAPPRALPDILLLSSAPFRIGSTVFKKPAYPAAELDISHALLLLRRRRRALGGRRWGGRTGCRDEGAAPPARRGRSRPAIPLSACCRKVRAAGEGSSGVGRESQHQHTERQQKR